MTTDRGGRRRRNIRGGAPKKKPDPKKRMTPAQQKLAQREREGRRAGLEEARKAQAALEARIAREAAEPAQGRVPGANWQPPVVEKPVEPPALPAQPRRAAVPRIPADATGNGQWTLGQARSLLRSGYHINKVVRVTGFGIDAFLDMEIDADGYGLPLIDN